jgi:hypothetical protein
VTHGVDRRLCDAAWPGDVGLIEALSRDPIAFARADPNTALLHAAHRGYPEAVLLSLPHADPLARSSEALWRAARYRRMGCIDLLVPVSKPEAWDAWQWAELPESSRARLNKRLATLGRTRA